MSLVAQDLLTLPSIFFELLQEEAISHLHYAAFSLQDELKTRGRSNSWPFFRDPKKKQCDQMKAAAKRAFTDRAMAVCPKYLQKLVKMYKQFYEESPNLLRLFQMACGGVQAFDQLPSSKDASKKGCIDLWVKNPQLNSMGTFVIEKVVGKRQIFAIFAVDALQRRIMYSFELSQKKVTHLVRGRAFQYREDIKNLHFRHEFFIELFRILKSYQIHFQGRPGTNEVLDPFLVKPLRDLILEYYGIWDFEYFQHSHFLQRV